MFENGDVIFLMFIVAAGAFMAGSALVSALYAREIGKIETKYKAVCSALDERNREYSRLQDNLTQARLRLVELTDAVEARNEALKEVFDAARIWGDAFGETNCDKI